MTNDYTKNGGLKLFCLLLLFSFQLSAQTAIQYGEDFTASIDQLGERDEYTFTAQVGDKVLIRMRGNKNGVDGCMALYGPDGAVIREVCSDGSLVSIKKTLTAEGTYKIIAQDGNDNDTGDYGLSLEQLNSPANSIALNCEASSSYELKHNGAVEAFSFKATQNDIINLRMWGHDAGIESIMEIYNAEGKLMTLSSLDKGMAQIERYEIPADGIYYVFVYDDSGNDVGRYNIYYQNHSLYTCATQITCGEIFYGSLEMETSIDAYTFQATAGEKVTARMRGVNNKIEASFVLYGPQGEIIETSVSEGKLAKMRPVELPVSGIYTFLAKDENGNDIGDYALTFQVIDRGACGLPLDCKVLDTPLDINDIVQTNLYQFEGKAEESLYLKLEEISDTVELRMELYAPSGDRVASGTIKSGDELIYESIILPETGSYALLVMDHEGNDMGQFQLSMNKPDMPDCNEAPTGYCESKGLNTDYEWIEAISVGDLQNTSGNNQGYGDYTEMVTDMPIGTFEDIALTPGHNNPQTPYFECWRIWIDLNLDGDFDDNGEMLFVQSSKKTIFGAINIPTYAATGLTRMRISMNYESYPSACEATFNYGEVEDYTVNLIPATVLCGGLPDGWKNQDIGSPSLAGNVCYDASTGTYYMQSEGETISGKEDEHHFAYTEGCGDATIIAQVKGLTLSDKNALAGVIIRKELTIESTQASMMITAGQGYAVFASRHKAGKSTKFNGKSATPSVWVKLVKTGKKIEGYISADGQAWEYVSKVTTDITECFYIGLASTSSEENVYNTAVFDNVSIETETVEDKVVVDNTQLTAEPMKVEVYPNPSTDIAFVSLDEAANQAGMVIVSNSMGEVMYSQKHQFNSSGVVDINLYNANIPEGYYTITIIYNGEKVSQPLMVVNP